MTLNTKKFLAGFMIGIVFPFLLGAVIFSLNGAHANGDSSFSLYWLGITRGLYIFSPFIRLGCIINLGIFFLLLRFNQDRIARGVLIATMAWGAYVVAVYLMQ